MDVISAVVKERDYYKDLASEAQDVIKQLANGPGDVELIHPLDLEVLLRDVAVMSLTSTSSKRGIEILTIGDKKYRQSVLVPRKKI